MVLWIMITDILYPLQEMSKSTQREARSSPKRTEAAGYEVSYRRFHLGCCWDHVKHTAAPTSSGTSQHLPISVIDNENSPKP